MEPVKNLILPKKWESGFDEPRQKLSAQEVEQMKADSYNRTVGKLNEADGYNCDLCKNRGYIDTVYNNEQFGYYHELLVPCKCQRIRSSIHKLNRSGLKNMVKNGTFAKFEAVEPWQKIMKTAAERFCTDEEHFWFFIGGQSGSGKSHLCCAIAAHYIRKGKDTKYMLWRDEIAKIKACVNDVEQYAAMMDELKKTEVLYIDDLFKTGKAQDGKPAMPTAADVNAAFEVINYRYNNPGLITIISSERTLNDLNAIDEAIAGRIAERSKAGGYFINLNPDPSKNYRLKGVIDL